MAEEEKTTSVGRIGQAREFVKDVRVEFTRVSWPSRLELRDSTVVVIVMVLLVSAFLFVWDRLFSVLMNLLFTGGGR